MASLSPNLSIPVNRRRSACVLDPSLFLSQYGPPLVQSLGEPLEIWIARELWHILDNPDFCLQQPESILPATTLKHSSADQVIMQQQVVQRLTHWAFIRAETCPTHLNLFWIGDSLGESFFPHETDPKLMTRWEALASSLDQRLTQQSIASNVLASAVRDTAALAAALSSAFILTYQAAENYESAHTSPDICLMLEQWEIPCQQIEPLDAIASIERKALLQLIIPTGLQKYLWAGLHLIVLHLVVPSVASGSEASLSSSWRGAQGFWYRL